MADRASDPGNSAELYIRLPADSSCQVYRVPCKIFFLLPPTISFSRHDHAIHLHPAVADCPPIHPEWCAFADEESTRAAAGPCPSAPSTEFHSASPASEFPW